MASYNIDSIEITNTFKVEKYSKDTRILRDGIVVAYWCPFSGLKFKGCYDHEGPSWWDALSVKHRTEIIDLCIAAHVRDGKI